MIDKICEKSKCTACFACRNVCPFGAISFSTESDGGLYPAISDNCTECKLCQVTCPANTPVKLNVPLKAFAAFSNDNEVRKSSTSGGTIFEICNNFDGIIYGAVFTKGLNVEHIRLEDKNNLYRTQGSKYVHSRINNSFTLAKQDLENGSRVLFTGTPCQIAGLKSFLKKDYENLYTIDFVCHGVPDANDLKDFISAEVSPLDFENAKIRFRDEKGYHMTVWDGSEFVCEIPFSLNFYYHGFLEGWSLRENCHQCAYSSLERCSDLTACDCWSGKEEQINIQMKNGLNGILINTEKGNGLLSSVKEKITLIESTPNEAKSGIVHLNHPSPETKYSKRYLTLRKRRGAEYALKNTVLKKKIIFAARKLKNARNSNN